MKLNVEFSESNKQSMEIGFRGSEQKITSGFGEIQTVNVGKNGLSAYEIAVKNGFEGNEQEWLESLNGEDGKDGYTPIKGKDYFDGVNGKDGYTPVKNKDYFDGKDGTNGKDGYTPVKGVDYFDGVNGKDGKDGTNGINGKDGADGYTPVKGTDYFTDADKTEMVSAVIAQLPVYDGSVTTV